MSKVSISNHKGGVGKTTSAINIGAGLNILKKESFTNRFRSSGKPYPELRGFRQGEEYLRSFKRREYKLEPITVLKGLDVIPPTWISQERR
jgi:chromosome partitioning protein